MFHHVLAPDTMHITIIEIAPDSAETKQWELPWQDTSDISTSVCWMLVNYGPSNDTASSSCFLELSEATDNEIATDRASDSWQWTN